MRDRVVDTPPTGHVAHIVATDYEAPDLNKETRYQLHRTAREIFTDLLVLQFHVSGLDDEPLEGGVVRGGELEADLGPRDHQVGAEAEVGWGGSGLCRVVVAGSDSWR